jgi:stage V sporulation protein AD
LVKNSRTYQFPSKPSIVSTAVAVGPLEKESPFHPHFDHVYEDERLGQETNEKGHSQLVEDTCNLAIMKGGFQLPDIDLFLGGDLVNQMTPTNFAARQLATPYMGMFSACATSISSLITASFFLETKQMDRILFGAASQHNAVERQFRYPIEYGAQKPPSGQWTVTGAGYGVLSHNQVGKPFVQSATIGQVVDCECTDPLDMGSAMAPAAFDTIQRHLAQNKGTSYDFVMTGDLGKTGSAILQELIKTSGVSSYLVDQYRDAGAEFYGNNDKFLSGASGAGCSATVYLGPIYAELLAKQYKKILLVATGALLSPLSFQQGESIPCIAHAVELSME